LHDLPAAGLAKRYEEVYWEPERRTAPPIRLPLDSAGLKVLQRIRDEAHRFALTYHRKLRARRIRESVLDELPGVGERRKQQLVEHFGSLARLQRASVEDIAALPGFGPSLAAHVWSSLHQGQAVSSQAE
jgi:excinuclease ABC subunit C